MGTPDGQGPFAALLHHYRTAAGLAQEELAERAGLSRRGISDLERGARRTPYPATVRRLAEALGLNASEQAELRAAARGKPLTSPPAQVIQARRLPLALTSLVGREEAVSAVQALLTTARLLTLTGVGGIGKTRLAIEVARQHPEPVFVDLAPLVDGRLVASAIAAALDLDVQPGLASADVLATGLASRHVLLILDNCEHLAEACAEISAPLLCACPELSILATSRQRLGVSGEQLYPVPALQTAQPAQSKPTAVPPATRLFVARARLVQPAFALNDESASRIADICRHLDGLPLAIELAAARVPLLGLEELRKRLDGRLDVLKSTTRGVPVRHQTLAAAVEWSYDLLSAEEQTWFRNLSVFSSTWTCEAAAAVCTDGVIGSDSALDMVEQLADKSLVHAVPDTNGGTRYRMLETVRQFARERFYSCSDARTVLRRYVDYHVGVAENLALDFGGSKPQRAFSLLELEHDNLRAALHVCVKYQQALLGLRLVVALAPFWVFRGHVTEGREWLTQVLSLPGGEARTPIRAQALSEAGFLALRQGDFAHARSVFEESVAIRRECGDMDGLATCLNALGLVADDQGDYASATSLHEQSLAIRRQLRDPLRIAASLNNLGGAIAHQAMVGSLRAGSISDEVTEDCQRARSLLEEARAIRGTYGERQWMAGSLMNLGFLADFEGDYATARSMYEEALAISRELGDRESIGWVLEGLSMLAAAQDKALRALRLDGAAASVRAVLGTPLPFADTEVRRHRISAVRQELGDNSADAAWAEGAAWSLDEAITYALQQPSPS